MLFNLNCVSQAVAVTGTATRIRLDGDDETIRVVNTGASIVYVALGDSTVVATVASTTPNRTSLAVLAGSVEHFYRNYGETQRYVSLIAPAASTATVILSSGFGE